MTAQPQARAKSAENQPHSIMTPGIQQLQQEGFGPGQIRALGEFMQGLIDRTVQPIVERLDRRLDQVDQRLERVDQRLERVDQRLDQVDQHLEQVDRQIEHANQRVDREFAQIDRRFTMISNQLENLQESVRGLQRWSWMPYLVMGLAFAGLYIALFGIWLAIVSKAA